MRITGGTARGIQLKVPKGDGTRPATDRMREAVFSSLGTLPEGCRVADLFAGTGAYGLEALSRGAASAAFYENDRHALRCLQENLRAITRSCKLPESVGKIFPQDVHTIQNPASPTDLIFIDPPYDQIQEALVRIFATTVERFSHRGTRVVLELPGNLTPEVPGWQITRRLGKLGKDKPTAAIFERL